MAAPGHLHGLEPGHSPLWAPQHGGLTAKHSPLLNRAMEKMFFCTHKPGSVRLAPRAQLISCTAYAHDLSASL